MDRRYHRVAAAASRLIVLLVVFRQLQRGEVRNQMVS
jgi:hypothetical protein